MLAVVVFGVGCDLRVAVVSVVYGEVWVCCVWVVGGQVDIVVWLRSGF